MVKLHEMLGSGIYTLREAALYARVPPQRITRWLFGNRKGKAVIMPQFSNGDRLVSFLDLVQTVAIREITLQKKVPISKIRQAIRIAKQKYNMDYPFARDNVTYLLGNDLVIQPGDAEYVAIPRRAEGQRLFRFVESYLQALCFDSAGLANLYKIYEWQEVPIVMNPGIKFGEPLLPSGYSAMALWESITIEGGIDQTAKVYGIPKEEVEASYSFFVDHLGKAAA